MNRANIEAILDDYPLTELIAYYERQSQDAMSAEDHKRYLATAYYLKSYNELPFTDV